MNKRVEPRLLFFQKLFYHHYYITLNDNQSLIYFLFRFNAFFILFIPSFQNFCLICGVLLGFPCGAFSKSSLIEKNGNCVYIHLLVFK